VPSPRLLLLLPLLACSCGWLFGGDEEGEGDVVYGDSRCEIDDRLHCARHITTLNTGLTGLTPRKVHWQVPVGDPPESGWPVAILFQGSFVSADSFWDVPKSEVLGVWNQGLLTKTLLDGGFAVITPEARLAGTGAWETNIPPMSLDWSLSGDNDFMLDIFDGVAEGQFGELDSDRLYAAGISSGGYMTSRMDLEYRSRFRALAIESGSWATCGGPLCGIPTPLSPDHRPTLFLHGRDDAVVPIETMLEYHQALLDAGVETQTVIAEGIGHAWIDAAPAEILRWFSDH
jgi:poly(3-hydroxybutyrate) depolymerase